MWDQYEKFHTLVLMVRRVDPATESSEEFQQSLFFYNSIHVSMHKAVVSHTTQQQGVSILHDSSVAFTQVQH